MIADWDTNHLFLADRLETDEPALFAALRSVLSGVPIDTILETRDIWCRDFMPVQLRDNEFCQFVYAPDYLRGHEHLVTPPESCRLPFMDSYHSDPIVLDGGNVVASRTKVILTDKVYRENPEIGRGQLRQRLEQLFQAECIIIPKEPYDAVGHADGVVRFVTAEVVLINDYSEIASDYGTRLRTLLEGKGLEVEMLPMFQEHGTHRRGELPSAVGLYLNYLRVGNRVILPSYGRPEDYLAQEKFRALLPDAVVSQVPCRSLAAKGGVLNCISWTVKDSTTIPR